MAACGASSGNANPAKFAAALRITYTDPLGFVIPETYQLQCDPPSGSAPHPSAICEAIANQPALVLSGPGQNHSCPPLPSVEVRGIYRGAPIDVTFSGCLGGQDDLIARWLSLLPTAQIQNAVRLDRGLGLLNLKESRAAVQALLGPSTQVSKGIHIYRPGEATGFLKAIPVMLGVGYDHAGRVETLVSNSIQLTLDGHPIASTAPRGNGLTGQLSTWVHLRCGRTAAIADHPLIDRAPATIIESTVDHPTIVIAAVPKRACVAQTGA